MTAKVDVRKFSNDLLKYSNKLTILRLHDYHTAVKTNTAYQILDFGHRFLHDILLFKAILNKYKLIFKANSIEAKK